MNQMEVNVEQVGLAIGATNHMVVPNLLEQRPHARHLSPRERDIDGRRDRQGTNSPTSDGIVVAMPLLLALLLTIQLGAPFGDADAKAVSMDGDFVVEVSVEAPPGPDAVLARIIDAGRELPPVALSPLGDGRYGGLLTFAEVRDVRVAFEARLGVDVVTSDLVTLTDLGVDPVVFDGLVPAQTVTGSDDGDAGPSSLPLVLGVLLAVASLAALAVWARSVDKWAVNPDNTANADQTTASESDPSP